ncbi:uncharacterized protein LOC109849061 isoform X2 [Asparagus officinalis]|uniref:uncharacterized protein LOC109849061 isoform X2 n=1 Tax=Asparagus officinalis TaxID=4686 RepID=UPI00098E7E2B|nr:uncharacterized protein LOC109849061 isoform X2 [Asparagus officinalis]
MSIVLSKFETGEPISALIRSRRRPAPASIKLSTGMESIKELTSMKERLKTMQHELGCTVAVLRMKNLALDEKEKLNKELSEKIRIVEEHANNAVDATIIRPTQLVSNSMNPQSDEKELYNEFCENARAEHSTVWRIQRVHQYLTLIVIACPPTAIGGVY